MSDVQPFVSNRARGALWPVLALTLLCCSGCVKEFMRTRVQRFAERDLRNQKLKQPRKTLQPASALAAADSATVSEKIPLGKPQVLLVGYKTDVARRYLFLAPRVPVPPFLGFRRWLQDHKEAVHCLLEWRDEFGHWYHAEMRSTNFEPDQEKYQVGVGEFPGTAYEAYGIYIIPARAPRDFDGRGRPVEIVFEEELSCDYRSVDAEIRKYGLRNARPGAPGTGGTGKENVGLGGPAYKPAQNSNTMVSYVLKRCGIDRPAPDRAVGWDRVPHFPYSTEDGAVKYDNAP